MERIFDIWPSLAELARDLGKSYTTVASWRTRGSIPGEYDVQLVEAAKARGRTLTFEEIARERAPKISTTQTKEAAE